MATGISAWISAVVHHEWVWRGLVAMSIALIGIWLARWLARILDRVMLRFSVEGILRDFLRNLAFAVSVVIVFIAALDFVGVPTTSLLAVLGAAGLGVGLALKDSLSNIASGVMLIVLRPFHAGDSVQIAALEGVIESVRIFQTRMHTADHRLIILPNSQITSAPIINYTAGGKRRVDVPLAVAYGDDIGAVRALLLAAAAGHPKLLADPPADVIVSALGESTVSVVLRAWVAAREHAAVQAELFESVIGQLSARGLRIPLPQREVHVFHHGDGNGAGTPATPGALDEAARPGL